jgi:cytochrome c peroxidase
MATAGCILLSLTSTRAQDDESVNGSANIGERLFLETRFAEFFYTNSGGDANAVLATGDPVVRNAASIYGPLPGPFAGYSMNCRQCHMVEEEETSANASILPSYDTGNRTYCDFAQRSPVPDNGDGRVTTPRNAMPLVDSLLPRSTPLFLHFDGQFATPQDLVVGTLTGRNYGWMPTQYATAIHHIASIIRNDDGSGQLAQNYGGYSYATAFAGGPDVTEQYLVAPQYEMQVDVTDTNNPAYVTDEQIVQNIAALITAYLETLVFLQDTNGEFNGSPYDTFLIQNGLPRQPNPGETPLQYSQRLLQLINNLNNPQFVTDPADGSFTTQNQQFQFGTNELAGLKIFFALSSSNIVRSGAEIGNCVACHTPPAFSDFIFHNTGAAQEEYDSINGNGTFMALSVPGLAQRESNYDAYLPPTTNHPYALGTFESPPSTNDPGLADLGLWNVFANSDFSAPQPGLQQIVPLLVPGGLPQPVVNTPAIAGGDFLLTGNGIPGWTYYVLATTNLMLPLADWQVVATNFFDSSGNFSFVDQTIGGTQKFYRLTLDTTASVLPFTIGLFKTPTVRDLSSSEPYFHTGRMDTIEDVINFYENFSAKDRAGLVRNGDPQLTGIFMDTNAVVPLAAFLRSLNEDYTDVPCPCLLFP